MKNENNEKIDKTEKIMIIETDEKDELLSPTGKNKIFEECKISISQIDRYDDKTNIFKSICELKVDTKKDTLLGKGFLLKFVVGQETIYCLISYGNLIGKDIISNFDKISLFFNNELISENIKFRRRKRYINNLIDIGVNITIIEIIKEDNLSNDYFLDAEYVISNDNLINRKIYMPHIELGKELIAAIGKIKQINKYEFIYSISNQICDPSGRPLFLQNSHNIVGINKGSNKDLTEGYGYLINPIINIIKNKINERRNNGKYINGKYIYEDGKYYIGEYEDNIPNGKGIKYYSNGNILFEGNFINGKFEGDGKYYYDNGDYFIGQYKNGLRNGKGTIYYKNENIRFEGEYINDQAEGYGKCILETGASFIGQFKNNLKNGKGVLYYPDGNIFYDGDYINDKRNGKGKCINKDGSYYIGQFKDNSRNGKGIQYSSKGDIIFEGDWVNDTFNGSGKYKFKSGNYYIGSFKDGKIHGKGIFYYSNGNIRYEGDCKHNKIDGNGKLIYKNGRYYIGQWKNDSRHGKGTVYVKGSFQYKGDFVEGEKNGIAHIVYFGKIIKYYIGQVKNGLYHGKGTIYYAKIKKEGNWINGKYVGK